MKWLPTLFLIVLFFGAISTAECPAAGKDDRLYEQGLSALSAGHYDQAIKLISEAIEINPSHARYYNDRGVAHKRAGRIDEALADYTKALEIKPDFVSALNNRAVAYIEKGHYDKAIEVCTEALKHDELKSKIYTNRGLAYARMGDNGKAIEDFKRAVSYQPVDERSFIFMAESLVRTGDKEHALKMYQLAAGLAKDKNVSDFLEKRIADLEKTSSGVESASTKPPSQRSATTRTANGRNQHVQPLDRPSYQTQEPKPALPRPSPEVGRRQELDAPGSRTVGIDTIKALDRTVREQTLKGFSPAAAEMYQNGRQFLEKSDARKALVRFEDTLQIARTNRNARGAAWVILEIGRVYAGMGDYQRAIAYFQNALKVFQRLKAADEEILALTELAITNKAAGLAGSASGFYSKAKAAAVSRGYHNLARAIEHAETEKVATSAPERSAASAPAEKTLIVRKEASPQAVSRASKAEDVQRPTTSTQTRAQAAAPSAGSQETKPKESPLATVPKETGPPQVVQSAAPREVKPLETIGRGPVTWDRSGKKEGFARSVEQLRTRPSAALDMTPKLDKKRPSHREVLWMKRSAPAESTVEEDLQLLNKLKQRGDEANLIKVLERLADKYERQKKNEKVVYSLTAALAFREKLGLTKDMDSLLLRAGVAREKRGLFAEALEDYTRGLVLAQAEGKVALARQLNARAKKLAQGLRLDSDAAAAAFETLWKARMQGKEAAETEAFYRIGSLYEKAGRLTDAVQYYEKAQVSLLAQRANLLDKLGRMEQAAISREDALKAFRKIDYSRYLLMMKKTTDSAKLTGSRPLPSLPGNEKR